MLVALLPRINSLTDSDPLITQDLVDQINNNPKSSFKAFLNPKWSKKTIGDAKKFLSPVRQAPINHGSARPVGYSERLFHNMDKRFLSGTCTQNNAAGTDQMDHALCPEYSTDGNNDVVSGTLSTSGTLHFPVYDVSKLCSSWAPAVTSAMSSALYRWEDKTNPAQDPYNLSLLFILDCDILGDPCVERPPLSAYEQFWRRYIPPESNWDLATYYDEEKFLRPPSNSLTQEQCNKYNGCYPGIIPGSSISCARKMVMTGVCEPGSSDQSCPIYFLYNWRWMKSHIAEVGPITSSILVHAALFTYKVEDTLGANPSVYSSGPTPTDILGMLDVTIIGWGQTRVNLSSNSDSTTTQKRWWYMIPHFGPGTDKASLPCQEFYRMIDAGDATDIQDKAWSNSVKFNFGSHSICTSPSSTLNTGVIRFNRRFDDCNIESQAVGGVPHNFRPHPYRSPRPTWSGVWEAVDA